MPGLLLGLIVVPFVIRHRRRKARDEIKRRREAMESKNKVRRPNKGYKRRKRKWVGIEKAHHNWRSSGPKG